MSATPSLLLALDYSSAKSQDSHTRCPQSVVSPSTPFDYSSLPVPVVGPEFRAPHSASLLTSPAHSQVTTSLCCLRPVLYMHFLEGGWVVHSHSKVQWAWRKNGSQLISVHIASICFMVPISLLSLVGLWHQWFGIWQITRLLCY
jgi:hypothetical protein